MESDPGSNLGGLTQCLRELFSSHVEHHEGGGAASATGGGSWFPTAYPRECFSAEATWRVCSRDASTLLLAVSLTRMEGWTAISVLTRYLQYVQKCDNIMTEILHGDRFVVYRLVYIISNRSFILVSKYAIITGSDTPVIL